MTGPGIRRRAVRCTVVAASATIALVIMQAAALGAADAPPVWSLRTPATSPSARTFASVAYDAAHRQVVLFGGFDGTSFLGDTWTWNGSTWHQRAPATSPSPRDDASMAYDSTHHRVILFGGVDATQAYADTWAWTGTTWQALAPATAPSARATLGSLSDDPALGGLMLYGGFDFSGVILGETWAWTGTNWEQLHPTTDLPPLDPSLAYSARLQKVVAFGGYDGVAWHNSTFTFDGTTWTQVPVGERPSARAGQGMAAFGNDVVVSGGFNNGTYWDDSWLFNGSKWTQLGAGPSARSGGWMAFDTAHGVDILFGGRNLNTPEYFADTWALG
jgi:hypothetical protein